MPGELTIWLTAFRGSSMVEHPAVNRNVEGSSPSRGALVVGAKLTHQPVNGEPRRREVAGFFHFGQYPQGLMARNQAAGKPERAR
jgi:hypothetical protein